MNDLDLIERFRADLPPADPSALARARARMFRAAAAPPHRRRWTWGLIPAGALAAAVVVAAFSVRADRPPVSTPDDAGRVLRLAAAEARRDAVLAARPDQFVYVQSLAAWAGGSTDVDGREMYIPPVEKDRRIWLSVDGTRTGLLREKVAKPGTPVPRGRSVLTELPLDAGVPAYLRDLPTDPKAMRDWLYRGAVEPGKEKSKDTVAFTKVGDTLREQYVPPAAVAALYEAAATIPGNTVTKQVDLAGRHGIAVSRTDHGVQFDLIFDASTYKFLGERELVVGDSPPFPKGAVIGWTAQLRVAIVDRAGQLP